MNKIKYRLYKKGDLVSLCTCQGREPSSVIKALGSNTTYIVYKDELEGDEGVVITNMEGSIQVTVPVCFIRLVAPVGKLKPYEVLDSPATYQIVDHRRPGSSSVITLHKSELTNTRELADKLCADLNNTASAQNYKCPYAEQIDAYDMILNAGGKCWELRHLRSGKVHAAVFYGEDGFKFTKDTAKDLLQTLLYTVEDKPKLYTNDPPCADCQHWTLLHSHGSTCTGRCNAIYSCTYCGPFDNCPHYKYINN